MQSLGRPLVAARIQRSVSITSTLSRCLSTTAPRLKVTQETMRAVKIHAPVSLLRLVLL